MNTVTKWQINLSSCGSSRIPIWNPYESKQITVFQNWLSSSKDDQFDFMIWLVGAINSLYKSHKYTTAYKLSVVNATEKKAILNEVKLIVREEAQAMV